MILVNGRSVSIQSKKPVEFSVTYKISGYGYKVRVEHINGAVEEEFSPGSRSEARALGDKIVAKMTDAIKAADKDFPIK